MNHILKKRIRVLSIAPTNLGFGYFVMEGPNEILAFGTKEIRGKKKNQQALSRAKKLIGQWQPQVLTLQNVCVAEARRVDRIKSLLDDIAQTAETSGLKVVAFSGKQLRKSLLNDPNGTKHQMATEIAKQFPDALAEKLPPKRRAWDVEHWRMGMFDAAALALTFWRRR